MEEKTSFYEYDWIISTNSNATMRRPIYAKEIPFTIKVRTIQFVLAPDERKYVRSYLLSGFRLATTNEIKREEIRRMFKDNKSGKWGVKKRWKM